MSEPDSLPDLQALVAAIQELTNEVAKLREAMETDTQPRVALIEDSVAATVAPGPTQGSSEQSSPPMTGSDRVRTAIDQTLAALFTAAMTVDEDDGFDAFLELMHSSRTDAPLAVQNLRQFSWKSLRKNLRTYLRDPADPTSFTVVRCDPHVLTDDLSSLKLFLGGTRPSDTPINLRTDDGHKGQWRVTDSSL